MPRGRPRKVPLVDPVPVTKNDKLVVEISTIVHENCSIPGCAPRWHIEEAQKILNMVRLYE